ncbi:MAG: UDP-2,3-diacylglucosamine diphosphatase [Gemmatimonadaceae bacterium]|nr:UDP-2,3-diacylglucosamine diphosphatase [Gemmatimonadaceae bacterium]
MRMLPPPSLLMSDAHLGAAPSERERDVAAFFEYARRNAGSVVINGDLFDFWSEWRTVMPRGHVRVLGALAALADAGIPLVMIAGNHDAWGGDVLTREIGAQLVTGEWDGELGGWRAHIAHGDGLRVREDRWYRAFKRVMRHPLAIRAFGALHPDFAMRVASGTSNRSRSHGALDGGSGLRAVAHGYLAAHRETELVVFGHSHVATVERVPTGGVYANPGAWVNRPAFLVIRPERIELRAWSGSSEGDLLDAIDRRAEKALADA